MMYEKILKKILKKDIQTKFIWLIFGEMPKDLYLNVGGRDRMWFFKKAYKDEEMQSTVFKLRRELIITQQKISELKFFYKTKKNKQLKIDLLKDEAELKSILKHFGYTFLDEINLSAPHFCASTHLINKNLYKRKIKRNKRKLNRILCGKVQHFNF